MNNEVNVPEGGMAMAIKALAESLGGVAVARPEWTDFEQQKERLGLAVIAVVASIQGHSDDWVKRDDLPRIIEQARSQEHQRVKERITERVKKPSEVAGGLRTGYKIALEEVFAALAVEDPEQPARSEGVGSGAEWDCCNCGKTAPAGTIYWWEPLEPEKEGRLCGDCADWTETEKAAICLRRNGFEGMAGFLTDAAAGELSSQPAPPPQAVQGEAGGEVAFDPDTHPANVWIECVDGYLRVMPPGDWLDFEGTVHYVPADCQPEKGGKG